MSEIKNGGLDQYGAEAFEQQQFGTAGVEGVNLIVQKCEKHVYREICVRITNISLPHTVGFTWPSDEE